MAVLVTGGAGYIGSHMALALLEKGEDVVILDDLSKGFRFLAPDAAQFVKGDIADAALVEKIVREAKISDVIHFAGSVVVPESVENPLWYYENNTVKSRTLIETCIKCGVKSFIFSSTAAVYGIADTPAVSETAPLNPISPYGRSKLMTEWMLEDAAAAHDFRYVALRYFNVAGADPELRSGQAAQDATHLIKVATQTALGKRDKLSVFGDDYPTRDGTCIRDYIHVCDLVDAHVVALAHLRSGGDSSVYNCGYGHGYSVKEVIAALEKVSGRKVAREIAPRRAGDPVELVADSARLRAELGWTPKRDDLAAIIETALNWERALEKKAQGGA